jgi:tripartite-type tricarboxylate transporter receptor subunit TctC
MPMPNIRIMAAIAALLTAIAPTAAQDLPSRPVTMVYPFAAGSAADVMGRLLASRLSDLLAQSVVFENVGGAGGMIGSNRVAKAPPDGGQFVLGGTFMALNQTLYKNPLYNLASDFTPVTLIVKQPVVLITRKDLPASTLPEFIAYAKANQVKMQYASGGVGSMPHLACELLNRAIGVTTTHVPYRGGGPLMPDLIAGRVDYFCALAATAIPQIESRTVNAIAVFANGGLPVLPNLPSAHAQGLTDFEVNPWYALYLPKAAPAPIAHKLRDATIAAMAMPEVHQRLKELGYTMVADDRSSAAYLQKFTESEIRRWAAVIKTAGIAPQ